MAQSCPRVPPTRTLLTAERDPDSRPATVTHTKTYHRAGNSVQKTNPVVKSVESTAGACYGLQKASGEACPGQVVLSSLPPLACRLPPIFHPFRSSGGEKMA